MRLKDFSNIVFFLLGTFLSFSQSNNFIITEEKNDEPITDVQVFQGSKYIGITNFDGEITFNSTQGNYLFKFSKIGFVYKEVTLVISEMGSTQTIVLKKQLEELSEVALYAQKKEDYELTSLKPVEGTHIYAGKKSEVINLDLVTGSKATNNARQVFAKVAGLNIYDNADGGLQLNIGGRGLDPNRTANFNTRQNDYDISADVLGYPESYYTPPTEAINQIQVIRGAASLQYGTQFGGLINFKLKKPNKNRAFNFLTRNTAGSFGTLTNFTQVDGGIGKFSYLAYANIKKGDGFRDNSEYNSRNFYGYMVYDFNEDTNLSFEATNFYYLAKQAGGLSDVQFLEDPYQSYRERNWFAVDWELYNLKFHHQFTEKTKLDVSLFALKASRKAVGFRTNPEDENANIFNIDSDEIEQGEFAFERDLLVGDFNNYGLETRFLHEYKLRNQKSFFLIGAKYYNASNAAQQGAGSKGTDADFNFYNNEFLFYPNQSEFDLPNENVSVFTENVFNLSNSLSITPGLRFEYIKTASKGTALDPLSALNKDENLLVFISDDKSLERNFLLAGIGVAYKPNEIIDVYANVSQNYRSVTFSDINTVTPSFEVDPNIVDETGYTFDIGVRGHLNKKMSYDLSVFSLLYDNRIGQSLDNRARWIRGNIGTAAIVGLESLIQWNIKETFFEKQEDWQWDVFTNFSIIDSEYTKSGLNGIQGNKVEFIPDLTFKTGMNFGYKNLLLALQYSYVGEQFTDATNSEYNPNNTNFVEGAIPAYDILDLSTSYKFNKNFKLEGGINNLLDNAYFTRRATGYPGPGIIPAEPRYYYVTLEIKI